MQLSPIWGGTPCWKAYGRAALSRWFCFPSLVYLPPSLGLASKSTDSCKIANLWERLKKDKGNQREKMEPPVFELADSQAEQCLDPSAACFKAPGSVDANSLHLPSEKWGGPWAPRGRVWVPRHRNSTRRTWSPAFGNCWSFLSPFLLEKHLALRNRRWGVFSQLDCWHTHWSLGS